VSVLVMSYRCPGDVPGPERRLCRSWEGQL